MPSNSFVSVQTMWRTGGTFIWNKFRNDPTFHAYIEPCHERLLNEQQSVFEAEMKSGVATALRHPSTTAAYFSEHVFMAEGGVPLFKKRFSFEDFYLLPHSVDDELKDYINSLLHHAWERHRRPMAKFCRFGLRSAWLKHNFEPVSVYVLRDPDAMFRSYWSFDGVASYFIHASLLIISKNIHRSLFQDFAREMRIPRIEDDSVQNELRQCCRLARQLSIQTLRDAVLLLWALTLAHNLTVSDLVIDMDLLATNMSYREACEDKLTKLLDKRLSLDDARLTRAPTAPGELASPLGIEIIRNTVRRLPDVEGRMASANFSQGTLMYLEAIWGSDSSSLRATRRAE